MDKEAQPKRGPGRPPAETPPMTKQNIRVPDDLWEQCAARAADRQISMSEYVRQALQASVS